MAWRPRDQIAQDVALEVLLHGPLSRAELARRLGLAPATLTRVSAELIAAGLLVESGQVTERRGRPSTLLQVVAEAHHFIGIKLSSDTLTTVVTDLCAQPVSAVRHDRHGGDPAAVADLIARAAADAAREHTIDRVGIAVGGVVGPGGVVTSAPFLEWQDVPLAAMVADRVGIPVSCANDLEAYTRSTHWFGEGSGHDNFAVLTLGIGVGYGCVANGRPLLNADSGVGLVGHWPLDPLGPPCTQGHRGCAEAMLTSPSIARQIRAATGRDLTWTEVLEAAASDDTAVRRILDQSGLALGKLVAAVANLTAPDLLVIGGEAVDLAHVAREAMMAGMRQHRDPRASAVEVVLAEGSNEQWCRGAAVCALQEFVFDHGVASG